MKHPLYKFIAIVLLTTVISCKKESGRPPTDSSVTQSTWTYDNVTYKDAPYSTGDGSTDCGNNVIKSFSPADEEIEVQFSPVSCVSGRPKSGSYKIVKAIFPSTNWTQSFECAIHGENGSLTREYNSLGPNNGTAVVSVSGSNKIIVSFQNITVREKNYITGFLTNKIVSGTLIEQ